VVGMELFKKKVCREKVFWIVGRCELNICIDCEDERTCREESWTAQTRATLQMLLDRMLWYP
jgi:hypothetical protein